MYLHRSHFAAIVSLALIATVGAGEPLQRQSASHPRIERAPQITAERAIELAGQFLRAHKADPSAYFISELNWFSTEEDPDKDAWVIVWSAKDPKAKDRGFTTAVFSQSKVSFVSTF